MAAHIQREERERERKRERVKKRVKERERKRAASERQEERDEAPAITKPNLYDDIIRHRLYMSFSKNSNSNFSNSKLNFIILSLSLLSLSLQKCCSSYIITIIIIAAFDSMGMLPRKRKRQMLSNYLNLFYDACHASSILTSAAAFPVAITNRMI